MSSSFLLLFQLSPLLPIRSLGALVLVLACLTPLVGWLGFFPYVALRGLGGLVVALARK